jgi:hypothetical protein
MTLPLLRSLAAIAEGDTHLIVTHRNGRDRKYEVVRVGAVHPSHCTYPDVDLSADFSTGGAVFDRRGDFVGLHHHSGDSSYCIFIRDVVDHLYRSMVLGHVGLPILKSNSEDHHDRDRDYAHDGSVSGIATRGLPRNPYGAGDVVEDMALQRAREGRLDDGGTPATLLVRKHQEVWAEYYDPLRYESLVLMLHAFHHHTALLRLIVEQLTSHRHRGHIDSLARHGGIGILLEALDGHPYDEALVAAGITALGRISLYEENREALSKYSGVQTVLSLMQEYRNTDVITQWGAYCLINLCHDTQRAQDNISAFVAHSGVLLVTGNMRRFPDSRYGVRWGAELLAYVVQDSKVHFDVAIDNGVCTLLAENLERYAADEDVAAQLCALLHNLTHYELFSAAVDFFTTPEHLRLLGRVIAAQVGCNDPKVLLAATRALDNMLDVNPGAIGDAVAEDLEEVLCEATLAWMTEAHLHLAAASVLERFGVDDVLATYPHLQLPAEDEDAGDEDEDAASPFA